MSVVVVSLHERDAPLELLERVAIAEKDLPKALSSLSDSSHLSEVVVLSTCLRTEVYAVLERFHDGLEDLFFFFQSRLGESESLRSALGESLIVEHDDAAIRHLFEVASGVDSAVLGEGEILRQVRQAADRARAEHTLGPVLEAAFRHAVEVGKRARSETRIARGMTSLSHAAVALALEHLNGSFGDRRVVVFGAGEMGAGIVSAVSRAAGAPEVVIVNRTLAHARVLAKDTAMRVAPFRDLGREIGEADVLFSATASGKVLVEAALVEKARSARTSELLVVDIAVPRDVEASVGELPGVSLFDVDDLRQFAELRMREQRGEVGLVEEMIDDELERYRANARGRSVAPVVAALRSWAEAIRVGELGRVESQLAKLETEERELIEALTKRIVAKLVHEPTVQIKNTAGSPRGERLVDALRTLFDL